VQQFIEQKTGTQYITAVFPLDGVLISVLLTTTPDLLALYLLLMKCEMEKGKAKKGKSEKGKRGQEKKSKREKERKKKRKEKKRKKEEMRREKKGNTYAIFYVILLSVPVRRVVHFFSNIYIDIYLHTIYCDRKSNTGWSLKTTDLRNL